MIISDLFIQNISGLPYIAKCYGGNYCIKSGSHSLITGFIAALNSFKLEINQEALQIIGFDKLTLVVEQKDDLLAIICLDEFEDHKEYRLIAKEIINEFAEQYKEDLERKYQRPQSTYKKFEKWLDKRLGQAKGNIESVFDNLTIFQV